MTDWDLAYLEDKEKGYASNTGTLYIDLPKSEQIGMIMLEILAGSVTTPVTTTSILDVATKIDLLLNGSKVAYSCTPEVGSFMYFLATGKLPPHELSDRGNPRMLLPILFGRHYRDEKYLLDTGNYKSAQLQIPYVLNTTNLATGSLQVTAWYERPTKPLSPEGFIRQRTIKADAITTAQTVTHDLPLDYPVLDIGCRKDDIDAHYTSCITDVKLNINSGREIKFDGRIEDLFTLNELMWGRLDGYSQWARLTNDSSVRTFMGRSYRDKIVHCERGNSGDILAFDSLVGSQAVAYQTTHGGVIDTNINDWVLQFGGLAPNDCLSILHMPEDQPYPLNEKSEAKVDYTAAAYTQTIETFIKEVVAGVLT